MQLSEIQTKLYRRLGWPDSPDAATVGRLLGFINDRYRELMSRRALERWRRVDTIFTSAADLAEYAFPFGIERVEQIRDLTSDILLLPRSIDWYRALDPDPADYTGTSEYWIDRGHVAIARRPAGTGLWAVSTAAGDTTQTVRITATRADGYQAAQTLTLNGTTRVQLGAFTDFRDVGLFTISTTATGNVELYNAAAAGTRLAEIKAGRKSSRYFGIYLSPTPASALTYQLQAVRSIEDLVNAEDVPLLPEDFHDILLLGARMDEYERRDDARFDTALAQYNERWKELKIWLYNHPHGDDPLTPPTRGSRLGAAFPAGT